MKKEYIGILVNHDVYKGIPKGKTLFEHFSFYEEAGNTHGLIPCFLTLSEIEPGKRNVRGYIKDSNGTYIKKVLPKPKIIHNRGLYFSKEALNKIKALQEEGILLFNERNRYTKLTIHEVLSKRKQLRKHLPETVKATSANLKEMMDRHDEIIMKPNNGSIGSGLTLLKRANKHRWKVTYYTKQGWMTEEFSKRWPEIIERKFKGTTYIIQERIPLATIQDSPFDLRVSVQKNGKGEWQVTGIVGKVAKGDHFVTNVARGGTCYSLKDIINEIEELTYSKVYQAIKKLSLTSAKQLSKELPNLADIGLDIGITPDGFPMIIECNARDLRITFKEAGMENVWKETHTTPISFAKYLLDQKKY